MPPLGGKKPDAVSPLLGVSSSGGEGFSSEDPEGRGGWIFPRAPLQFPSKVTQNFCIKNGKIISIAFKNGISVHFLYKT